MSNHPRELPEQPAAHRVYGGVVYWVCMAATVLCVVGPFLALLHPERNLLNPHFLFFAIWQGRTPQEVWAETGEGFPGAHFWLAGAFGADGIVQLGIVLGCSSAGIAFVATAFAYLRRRSREPGWAVLVLIDAAIITCAVLGIIRIGD